MAQLKKILITLPNSLIKEIDNLISIGNINRNQFIHQAVKLYLKERRKLDIRDKMKQGYLEMAEINLGLAEMYLDIDNKLQFDYEEKLAESE